MTSNPTITPAEIEALAERLEDQCEYVASREGSQIRVPVPICDEAATALRALMAQIAAKDAEVAALREALEQIASLGKATDQDAIYSELCDAGIPEDAQSHIAYQDGLNVAAKIADAALHVQP